MDKLRSLNTRQSFVKRVFDLFFSFFGLFFLLIPMIFLIVIASFSTNTSGLFSQWRVGQNGKLFKMYKIRTMRAGSDDNFITLKNDKRITPFGKFLRLFKLDELPQLFNVLIGNMSFVGPRPDVSGYADKLIGKERIILTVKPGITGPATIKFKHEEIILEDQKNPKKYNDEIIWPEKVKINIQYIENWSFIYDIEYIFKTIF